MALTKATKEPGIQFIEGIKGSYYRVQIRLKGCPHLSKNFDSFEEAKKWKRKTVAALQSGLLYETTEMRRLTAGDLIDRFIQNDLKKLRNHLTNLSFGFFSPLDQRESSRGSTIGNRFIFPNMFRLPIVDPRGFDAVQRAKKPKTQVTIIGHLQWWKNEIGYCILSQFREDIIAKCRDKLKKEPDSLGRPRSPATVNSYLCSLSSVINLAVKEWRLLQTSPLKNISKLQEPRGRERFLTQEEKTKFLQVCQESSCKLLFPIVLLALSTGMRKGEILGLQWKDIDLETGRINLHHTKNGDRRVVPVQGLALSTLQNLAPPFKNNPTYLEEYVFAGKKVGKPRDAQHQRMLEIQARQRFYASGGNREAHLAFLPFDSFPDGFYGYVKKSELVKAIANKTKNPAEN